MLGTIANGYPRGPLPAQPDRLADAERGATGGDVTPEDLEAVRDAFVREIVREQARAGLGLVGDGGTRHADRLLPIVEGLRGLVAAGPALLATGEAVTRPRVTGAIGWDGPITLDDWAFAAGLSELPAKQVVIGPYTIGRLLDDAPADRHRHTLAIAEALNAELRALAAAGAPVVQVDEDAATRIGDDPAEWALFEAAHRALTHGLEGDIVHLALAALGGAVDPAGFAAILDHPYRSVLFDALAGPDAWRFALAVPSDRGVVAGAADARRPAWDETEVLVWAMAWASGNGRGEERVGVAPNASLALLDRHAARRKCERMGEAVRIARMGPLLDVAEALEPDPLHGRMPELRHLAAVVDVARRPA